jgi:hypothetical protein
LAERLRRERPGHVREQIVLLWQLLFASNPTEGEMQKSLLYLVEQAETLRPPLSGKKVEGAKSVDASLQALSTLCQALLGSNRFLYLE